MGLQVHISGRSNDSTTDDRSPSPANLDVHLSLSSTPFDSLHHSSKHSRIYSGPTVTSAAPPPTHPPSSFLSSLPLQKEESGQSSTSSLDSATGFPRRRSLALSVSDLMGESVSVGGSSRPQTSAGVMEVLGERDAEGEEEQEERERPRTAE